MCSRPPWATSLSLNVLFVDDTSMSAGQEVASLCYLVAFATPRAKLTVTYLWYFNGCLYASIGCDWLFFFSW